MARITDTEIAGYLNDDILVSEDQMCICDGLFSSDNTNMIMKVELFKDTKNKRDYHITYIIFDADYHSNKLQDVFDTEESLDFGDVLTLNVWFGHGKDKNGFWDKLAGYIVNYFPSLKGYECSQLNLTPTCMNVQKFKNAMRRGEMSDTLRYLIFQNAMHSNPYTNMFETCPTISSPPLISFTLSQDTLCE